VLRRLRIENLVLIREAELELSSGLNAITGETGAGKTILAQAVGLLLGAKGDAKAIGPGAQEAYVEAEFDVPDGFFEEEGLEALAELRPADEPGSGPPSPDRQRTPYLRPGSSTIPACCSNSTSRASYSPSSIAFIRICTRSSVTFALSKSISRSPCAGSASRT